MSSTTESREFNLDEDDEAAVGYDSSRDTSGRNDALAKLSEEEENRVQMDEIRRMTVEPGLMKLPVGNVTTAENSEKWVLEIEHPVEGTHRFYFDKPLNGYSTDYDIVQIMNWYDVGSGDPYQLQFQRVYVRKDTEASDSAHGWVLEEPPGYEAPITQQLSERTSSASKWLRSIRPNMSEEKMYFFLLLGAIGGPLFHGSIPSVLGSTVTSMGVSLIVFCVMTIAGLIALDK